MAQLYRQHTEILERKVLTPALREEFEQYQRSHYGETVLKDALLFLCECLMKAYRQKVIVLIDEYDAPLMTAYQHGYLEAMGDFLKGLYSAVLKDNDYLMKGLMTGVLRVSKNDLRRRRFIYLELYKAI